MNRSATANADVHALILTLTKLMPTSRNGWVSWRKAAKELKGSEEYDVLLSSLAEQEQWKHLFARTHSAVKLTAEGFQVAASLQPIVLSETQQIADGVRKYAARLKRISLSVNKISRVAQVGKRCVQAFSVDTSENIVPSETPCEFRPLHGGKMTGGRIIGQEPDGSVIYVAMDSEVAETDLPAVLSIDRAYLLNLLAERVGEMPRLPARMVPVLHKKDTSSLCVANQNSLKVAAELAELPTPWTRFLWGPPGAGKTFGLGSLVHVLLTAEPESRTLLVAPSNRAVDVALEQFLSHLEKGERKRIVEQRRILRFGYPRSPHLLNRPELLGSPALDELNRKVHQIAAEITQSERERNLPAEIAVLRAELLAAQEEVKNAVAAHVQSCLVVATTVTLGYMPSSPVSQVQWDNVFVDEVTMVTPAMCAFLASLATKRFLLAGDPRQLGPVYENSKYESKEDYEWMGRDIFDKSGVAQGECEARTISATDERMARITSQRRCSGAIWSRVAALYPQVKHNANQTKLSGLTALPPCAGQSVILMDTSKCGDDANCQKVQESWQNLFTAGLALEVASALAAESAEEISIAIISPYNAQVRLLRRWLRQEQKAQRTFLNMKNIDAGTVHQFQGSDADVIIFDMTDSAKRKGVGNLLRGDTGLRLVNVAITRAKGKFILIANRDWCGKTLEREDNPLLWELVTGSGEVACLDVLPRLQKPPVSANPAMNSLIYALSVRRLSSTMKTNHVILDEAKLPIGQADIAFLELKLAVYCDGSHWNYRENSWRRGERHRQFLVEQGWSFCVFTRAEIENDVTECADIVRDVHFALLADKFKTKT